MTRPTLASLFVGSPRPGQAAALPELQDALESADVVCLLGPVGSGKTKLIEAAARWATDRRVGLATNAIAGVRTNALLDQYQRSLGPWWTFLRRKDAYSCAEREGERDSSCVARAQTVGGHCKRGGPRTPRGCPYVQALRAARAKGALLSCNWMAQVAHRLKPDLVCLDEAHGVPDFLAELESTTVWRKQWKWPVTFETLDDVGRWLSSEGLKSTGLHPKLQPFADALSGATPGVHLTWGEGDYFGQPTDFLRTKVVDARPPSGSSALWRQESKVLLASATLTDLDVELMGLHRKRVAWVRLPSAIPVARRPLFWWPVVDGRHGRHSPEEWSTAVAAVLAQYPDSRGVVHATYALARTLREESFRVGSQLFDQRARLRFHRGAEDKGPALAAFLAERTGAPLVLIVSGQYEGLDLADDLARFQVLTQAPRASIGDPAVRWLAERQPGVYRGRTLRDLQQAYGRVCRGPSDRGDTVLLDSSAGPELGDPSLQEWFREAIVRVEP